MRSNQVIAMLAVVSVIAVAGIGYAAFTSSIALNASASAGTLSIQWVGPGSPPTTTTNPNVTCSVVLTPTLVTMTVGGLFPGQSCTMTLGSVIVENTGTLGAAVSGVYTPGPVTGPGSPCSAVNYTVANSGFSPNLAPGASFPWFQTVGLGATAGNGCQGDSFTFTISLSATPT
jgi:hypothetical protein